MSILIDTVEGRLQLKIGQLAFENELLRQEIDERDKRIADLESKAEGRESKGGGSTDGK